MNSIKNFINKLICMYALLLTGNALLCEKITILTKPINAHEGWNHTGVTSSLLRGLRSLQVNFNYNPEKIEDIGSTVIVLTNIDALSQAIALKKSGRIKKLLAGPNLVVLPRDHEGILTDPAIDMCIVPSKWVKIAYIEEAPSLKNRIGIWPAGIDMTYWNSPLQLSDKKSDQVLVYWKTEDESFCHSIETLLQSYGWRPLRIKYGEYKPHAYKSMLENSRFAVFISRTESQSLALLEAWAMDVPTLIWDPQPLNTHGRLYSSISACPYLTKYTGERWAEMQELATLIKEIPERFGQFKPSLWASTYMNDKVATKRLLKLINSLDHAH